jgi:hypothetical protein
VLERNGTGKLWQTVLLDPNRHELERLRLMEGIFDFEESTLDLEEAYCALLARKGEHA